MIDDSIQNVKRLSAYYEAINNDHIIKITQEDKIKGNKIKLLIFGLNFFFLYFIPMFLHLKSFANRVFLTFSIISTSLIWILSLISLIKSYSNVLIKTQCGSFFTSKLNQFGLIQNKSNSTYQMLKIKEKNDSDKVETYCNYFKFLFRAEMFNKMSNFETNQIVYFLQDKSFENNKLEFLDYLINNMNDLILNFELFLIYE